MWLIDANSICRGCPSYEECKGECWCEGECEIFDILLKAPTIKPDPVRHGWWKTYRNFTLFANTFVCSECNYNYTSSGNNTNYCPNCGAKMDGGINDG